MASTSTWPCLTTRRSAPRPRCPKFISPADPAARWTGAHGGQAFFAYSANYLIDLDHAVIVDVEASTAVRQAKTMIKRADERLELYPKRLAATRRRRASFVIPSAFLRSRSYTSSSHSLDTSCKPRMRTEPVSVMASFIKAETLDDATWLTPTVHAEALANEPIQLASAR